jgi:hypothetical protein
MPVHFYERRFTFPESNLADRRDSSHPIWSPSKLFEDPTCDEFRSEFPEDRSESVIEVLVFHEWLYELLVYLFDLVEVHHHPVVRTTRVFYHTPIAVDLERPCMPVYTAAMTIVVEVRVRCGEVEDLADGGFHLDPST